MAMRLDKMNFTRLFWMAIYTGVLLVILAAILLGTWNYVVPRLAESVDQENYDRATKFKNIDYATAILLAIFGMAIWGGPLARIVEYATEETYTRVMK